MKYLGIDWGKSKIGLAIGDDELKIASPFNIISKFNELINIIKKEKINKVVLGNPIKMCGTNKDCLAEYIQFYQRLKKHVGVELIDERLTTKQALVLIRELKYSKKEDSVSAMLILQSYFDRI